MKASFHSTGTEQSKDLVSTNHSLTKMTLLNFWQLHMCEGRYTMSALLTKDIELMSTLEKMRKTHLIILWAARAERMETQNPQTLHKEDKRCMIKIIHEHLKKCKLKILKKIYALRKDLHDVLNDPTLDKINKAGEAAILDE